MGIQRLLRLLATTALMAISATAMAAGAPSGPVDSVRAGGAPVAASLCPNISNRWFGDAASVSGAGLWMTGGNCCPTTQAWNGSACQAMICTNITGGPYFTVPSGYDEWPVGSGTCLTQCAANYTRNMATGVCDPNPPTFTLNVPPSAVWGTPIPVSWSTINTSTITYVCDSGATGNLAPAASGSSTMATGPIGVLACTFTAAGPGGNSIQSRSINVSCPGGQIWDGAACVVPPSDCPGGVVASWGGSCSATIPTATLHGASTAALTNSAPGYNGSASFTCNNGSYVFSSGSCAAIPPPPTVSGWFTPNPVVNGNTYAMNWASTNATSVTYSCSGAATGSGTLSPASGGATSFTAAAVGVMNCTFTATGPGGTATASASLTVDPPPPANCGASVLAWGSCNGSFGGTALHGASIGPIANTAGGFVGSATFLCNNGGYLYQSGSCSGIPPVPTLTATATPTSLTQGGSYSIQWTMSAATSLSYSCSGDNSMSGSLPATTTGNQSFIASWVGTMNCTLTASGPGGTATSALSVTSVAPPAAPSLAASFSPSTVTTGNSYTLDWSSSNATSITYSCSGAAPLSGSLSPASGGSQAGTATWTGTVNCVFSATGPGGTVSQNASITANAAPPPAPTATCSISPATLSSGGTFSLSWSTTNATSLGYSCSGATTASGSLGPVSAGSQSFVASFTGTLNCAVVGTGPGGSSTSPTCSVTATAVPTCPPGQDAGLGVCCPAGSVPSGTPGVCIPDIDPTGGSCFNEFGWPGGPLIGPIQAFAVECSCKWGYDPIGKYYWVAQSTIGCGNSLSVYFLPNYPLWTGAMYMPGISYSCKGFKYAMCP